MTLGNVYWWLRDPTAFSGGHVVRDTVTLPRLEPDANPDDGILGKFALVRNGGSINVAGESGEVRDVAIGSAMPDENGNYLFDPHRGGGRIDKVTIAEPDFLKRYVDASHFGQVNTYYHLDLMAQYVNELLDTLGVPQLPRVVAVVNAHHGATEVNGIRDGVRGSNRWLPFQGGHYRLPSRRYDIPEPCPLSPEGEIHLGPGWRLAEYGGLPATAGARYRANASHNAGIIYHELGHHITRHTADLGANRMRPVDRQNNIKSAIDEGTCDYFTATMLGTPHIWAWHHRHDETVIHPRSLVSSKTMEHYCKDSGADPHANGTIWGAALWDLRTHMQGERPAGARHADRLVLKGLLLLGLVYGDGQPNARESAERARTRYGMGLAALLEADRQLEDSRHQALIEKIFAARGILAERYQPGSPSRARESGVTASKVEPRTKLNPEAALKNVPAEMIPSSDDLHSAQSLEEYLQMLNEPIASLIVGGDVMLGGRMRKVIAEHGTDHPFEAVRPLLAHASNALANLEGPFARHAGKVDRTYSYRVHPRLAHTLKAAGLNVMQLANNHLMDCGAGGVLETLAAVQNAGILPLGGGRDTESAHRPVILSDERNMRIGVLGYYWNRRCAAMGHLPGGAMDTPERIERDIKALRERADRVVVSFHWGIPYDKNPSNNDREKARWAIDCGADVVVGHHPHVLQPIEVYRGCPIYYSVGNFAFGSGNSKAEGMLVALRFEASSTISSIYPLYVKNRDPRVNYQVKVMRGTSARRTLERLAELSGRFGGEIEIAGDRGTLRTQPDASRCEVAGGVHV